MHNEDFPMINASITAAYNAGVESERRKILEELLAPIFAAFRRAQSDPNARVPTLLSVEIVAAQARCAMSTPAVRERQRA